YSQLSLNRRSRRPLRPILFPYTTLFRSPVGGMAHEQGDVAVERRLPCARALVHGVADAHRVGMVGRQEAADVAAGAQRQRQLVEDRKSTRLNSSHVATSYAVFCLNKKKL